MKIFLSILFFTSSLLLNAQTAVDTIKLYDCEYSRITDDGHTEYTVDNKKATKEEYMRILKTNQNDKRCAPCYALVYTASDMKISEGLFYYHCPNAEEEETENAANGPDSISISIHSISCRHGVWLEYDKNGEPAGSVQYEYGVKK